MKHKSRLAANPCLRDDRRAMKFILVFFIVATAAAQDGLVNPVELSGVVKSETGAPLAGVRILTFAPYGGTMTLGSMTMPASSKQFEGTTDSNGRFKIPAHGRLIYFYRADLRPVTKMVDLSLKQLDLVMEDGAKSLWKIPACSASDKANRVGIGFMVTVPENVRFRKETERFEEGGYFFGYKSNDRIETLINWWESTSLQPGEEVLLQSKEFSERRWASGDKWGHDFRGTGPDGKLWRWVSTRNGAITYQKASPEAAKVFDSMIDTMCFDVSAVKW